MTLSVATIEIVTITAVILTGAENPTLARDTMLPIVMIVLNGLVGLSLLLYGGTIASTTNSWAGVNSYASLIVARSVFGMIMPNFTTSACDKFVPQIGHNGWCRVGADAAPLTLDQTLRGLRYPIEPDS